MTPSAMPDSNQQPHVRHYPLDIDLPFEQYEHRRIVARDILVNRILSKFLFPRSKGLSQAYDTHRSKENGLHNFAPIKQHDKALARDLELLRKMLITCSITDDHLEPRVSFKSVTVVPRGLLHGGYSQNVWHIPLEEEGKVRVTVGEEIQDLVRRHYVETDDACLRVWLQAIQTPRLSSYNTLPKDPGAEQTHVALVQNRKRRGRKDIADDGKKWYAEDIGHLAEIQAQMQATRMPPLHDGGAFLPQLRLPLISSKTERIRCLANSDLLAMAVLFKEWPLRDRVLKLAFPWPQGQPSRRVLHDPSFHWAFKEHWYQSMASLPPLDFSTSATGRGLRQDGVWSTARHGDGTAERGRQTTRARRRATSEPPHGTFTSARLPFAFHLNSSITFPRMTLATMSQRSRRRSLSRTRVAEMFDWNSRPRQCYGEEMHQKQAHPEVQRNIHQIPSTYSERLQILSEFVEYNMRIGGKNIERVEWAELNRIIDDVFFEASRVESVESPCQNCGLRHSGDCLKPCGFCGAPNSLSSFVASEPSSSKSSKPFTRTPDDEDDQQTGEHGNSHMAQDCPVAMHNRCKCGPFPQHHVAAKCAVLCSRDCGNTHPPGHFKHKNAMTCKARCCMCGMKSHSGAQCKLKRCRCGGAHLGQDCTWKVECRVKGCYRFLCGLHCVDCGMSREQLEEGMRFEGRKCPACLGLPNLVLAQTIKDSQEEIEKISSANPVQDGSHRSKRRNRRKGRNAKPKEKPKEEPKEELPWYAPLQPRTRPIVLSKSGKRNVWKGPATS